MKQKLHFWCFTFLMLLCMQHLCAQQLEVSGVVKDAVTGNVLPGVTVTVLGTTTATSTAENGTYRIMVPNGNATLAFSLVGYGRYELNVNNQTTVNASLGEDQSQLSEVVVTAMGIERTERSLGYATQKIESKELNFNRQTNMVNSLQGKVAGVTVSSTGGAPGQGSRIQIRGVNSLDPNRDNQPLFVIDGVLMDNSTSTFGSGADLRGMSNRAVDVNPDDIESMNILRGGAATALYGLRGANGVVVITTKSGKAGRVQVNFNSNYGFDEVNKFPEIQNKFSQGFSGVYNPEDFWPSFGPTVEEARRIDPTHPAQLYNHVRDAFNTGYQFRNNLSFSGGSDRVTFLTSLSQFNQEGILPGTNFKNYQGRLNLDAKVSDKISVGANMNFTSSHNSSYNAIRYNEQLVYWSPRHDIRDYLEPNGKMKSYGGTTNPMYVANTNKLDADVNRFIGSFNVSYKPFNWLDFNYRGGVDTYNENRLRTAPGFEGLEGERRVNENGVNSSGEGFVFEYNTRFRVLNSTFVASAKHSFENGINGTFRLGHELYDRQIKNVGVEGSNLAVYDYFNISNAEVLNPVRSLEDYRLAGIFGELSLDYKQFIYLTLTGRNDITSSLLRPNNSFFYPSASLSYIFTENLQLPAVISNGKLRFSYASIGKDANPYSTSSGFANYVGTGVSGLPPGYIGFTRPSLLGDPQLRPEFTNTFEGGLDMSFFNNRLGFEATYYHAVSKDQIIQVPVSATTGYASAAVNAGDMRNKGIEITVHATPIRNTDFSWNTSVNFSANRNKVLNLRDDLDNIFIASQSGYLNSLVSMRLVEGEEYGALFGTSYRRYYTPEERAAGLDDGLYIDESRPLVIGANGFPIINPNSVQKILGTAQPRWIGGWNNTFNYKNLTLNLLLDARIGQYRYNQMNNFYAAFGMAKYTENRNDYMVFEGVLEDGTPNTQVVWLGQGIDPLSVNPDEPGSGRNYGDGYYRNVYRGVSEHSVEDASWVRVRSASFTYNLPSKLFENSSFIRHASFTLTGNNLWLWTPYRGYDPEASSFNSGSNAVDGFAGFTHPGLRSFLFTLNVGF